MVMSKTISEQLGEFNESIDGVQSAINRSENQISDAIAESSNQLSQHVASSSSSIVESITLSSNDVTTSVNELDSSLNQSIIAASEQLSDAVLTIVNTINSASDGVSLKTGLFTVFMAFIGSGSAFLFNLLHYRMQTRKESISILSKAYVESVLEIQTASVAYWLKECKDKKELEDELLEMKIHSHLRVCRGHTRVLASLLSRNNRFLFFFSKNNRYKDEINAMDSYKNEIYELVTGDSFGSTNRKVERERAGDINKVCSRITVTMSKLIYLR